MAIRTIVALFDDYREAEGAIRELEVGGRSVYRLQPDRQ